MSAFDYKFKFVLVGNSQVGKSQFLSTLDNGNYNSRVPPSIGVDFIVKNVSTNDNQVKIVLWDTSGKEKYRTLIKSYYRDAHVIGLFYDVCNEKSVNDLNKWMKEIADYCTMNPIIYIIGTKSDLDFSVHNKLIEQITLYTHKHSCKHAIINNKNADHVQNVFSDMCQDVISNIISPVKDTWFQSLCKIVKNPEKNLDKINSTNELKLKMLEEKVTKYEKMFLEQEQKIFELEKIIQDFKK